MWSSPPLKSVPRSIARTDTGRAFDIRTVHKQGEVWRAATARPIFLLFHPLARANDVNARAESTIREKYDVNALSQLQPLCCPMSAAFGKELIPHHQQFGKK
jgi:hypothetical protein